MNFLNLGYFGLSIFLVAVLLFYLFRKQYKNETVPSTLLWEQVMREWEATKWWRKLQRHLLLYLQLLIIAFLMVALTRPFLGHNELSGEHLIVVMDTSASMTAIEQQTTRLDLAKEEVEKLVDQLAEQKMTVILAEQTPSILFSNETNKRKILTSLKNIAPSYQATNINEAVQLGNQLLTGSTGEIHVFSDRVRSEDIRDTYLQHSVTVHNLGSTTNNIALHTFGVAKIGEKITGILSIFNETGKEQVLTITIEHEGEVLLQQAHRLEPKKLTQIELEDLPEKPYYQAKILNEDSYEVDNEMIAFLATDKAPSYYVGGDVNPFITKALSLLGTEIIQFEDYRDIPMKENAIYILGNVPSENWPNAPLLVTSPTLGGPFEVAAKVNLRSGLEVKETDSLLQFVNMEEVYIQKSYPYHSAPLQPILTSGENPIISKGYYKGRPLVLLGFDVEDTDWPLHPSFPVFLYNSIGFLTEQQALLGFLEPEEQKEVAFSTSARETVILDEDQKPIAKLNSGEGIMKAPRIPGLYRLIEETEFGTKERLFSVTIADAEKYIEPYESFSIEIEGTQLDETMKEHPNEIWKLFALVALVLVFIEWEVYRRGISS